MNDVTKAAIMSAVRTILGVAGGAVTAKGYLDDANVQLIIGAIMTLLPVAWGVWEKYRSETKTIARVEEAYAAGATNMPMPPQSSKGAP